MNSMKNSKDITTSTAPATGSDVQLGKTNYLTDTSQVDDLSDSIILHTLFGYPNNPINGTLRRYSLRTLLKESSRLFLAMDANPTSDWASKCA